MFEDIHSKQLSIKERIRFIGERLMENIGNDVIYSPIDEPSQRTLFFLGRIMNDGDNSGSDKITNGNIILESYGKRVKLDLSSVNNLSLFPGQIVAIKGINSSGKEINVETIYQNGYISGDQQKIKINQMDIDDEDDGVLQLMVCCGPFTAKNSLEFNGSPFFDFAQIVNQKKPNIVLLMGPFTDFENELIAKNEIKCTFDELFKHSLTSFVKMVGDHIKIIVVPSTKDVHHFTAFPQQKYSSFIPAQNVFFAPNPSEFNVNNVSFGVCSADFLWDCCSIGLTKNIKDRLLSMMTHCINQQNFYPLQPSTKSLRMDYNQSDQLYIKRKLDIFIMPSKLKQFAKIYQKTNTICINPSFLTRANSGGTYAILNIFRSNDYKVQDYTDLVRVDILRI